MAQATDAEFMRALESLEHTPEVATKDDICSVYKKVKPVLLGILPFIELIPLWGKKAAAAIRLLMKGLDALCPGA